MKNSIKIYVLPMYPPGITKKFGFNLDALNYSQKMLLRVLLVKYIYDFSILDNQAGFLFSWEEMSCAIRKNKFVNKTFLNLLGSLESIKNLDTRASENFLELIQDQLQHENLEISLDTNPGFSTQLRKFVKRFGSDLSILDQDQKMLLRKLLSASLWSNCILKFNKNDILLEDAYNLCHSEDISVSAWGDDIFFEAVEMLQGIDVNTTEYLLRLLQKYSRNNHFRLQDGLVEVKGRIQCL